ncbi:MAG: hypothetical protein WD208_09675 [Dehalococcoidia bacterium]
MGASLTRRLSAAALFPGEFANFLAQGFWDFFPWQATEHVYRRLQAVYPAITISAKAKVLPDPRSNRNVYITFQVIGRAIPGLGTA